MPVDRGDIGTSPVRGCAPTGRDAVAAPDLTERAGIATGGCKDYAALLAGLDGAAAVFVAEEGLPGQHSEALSEWIRAQPPWSDLPFVMLTSRRDHPQVSAWRQRQVELLGNVALLEL